MPVGPGLFLEVNRSHLLHGIDYIDSMLKMAAKSKNIDYMSVNKVKIPLRDFFNMGELNEIIFAYEKAGWSKVEYESGHKFLPEGFYGQLVFSAKK